MCVPRIGVSYSLGGYQGIDTKSLTVQRIGKVPLSLQVKYLFCIFQNRLGIL